MPVPAHPKGHSESSNVRALPGLESGRACKEIQLPVREEDGKKTPKAPID